MVKTTRLLLWMVCLLCAGAVWGDDLVTVDLSVNNGAPTYRASGFINQAFNMSLPAEALVRTIKPRLLRSGNMDMVENTMYNRLAGMNCTAQIMMSSVWWNRVGGAYPGTNGDWTRWYNGVADFVALAGSRTYQWDLWNEPDFSQFWPSGSAAQDQYFEMWRRTYLQLRQARPGEKLVGPSASVYNKAFITQFLTYCKTNNVLPDILSWHEFSGGNLFETNIADIKSWMQSNGINIPNIQINEYVHETEQYNPGILVDYFAAFERTKIDNASHSCWNDLQLNNNCGSQVLGGLLTYPERTARACWWVYKGYADITGQLVGLTSTAFLDGVAGVNSTERTLRILLGRQGGLGRSTVKITNISSQACFNGLTGLHVVAERIPYNGAVALASLTKELETDVSIVDNMVVFDLPNFNGSDAYSITLNNALSTTVVAQPAIEPYGVVFLDSVVMTMACATDGAQIRYTTNNTEPTSSSTLYSGPMVLRTRGVTTIKARAFKGGMTQSPVTTALFTITHDSCRQSSPAWQNTAMAAQADTFSVEFSVLASVPSVDGLIGLSQGPAYAYDQAAVAVRFSELGTIDARNGDTYAAATVVPYTMFKEYFFRVKVNVLTHRYSVYVTPLGGSEITLAQNYAFRTEQFGARMLNTWNIFAYTGQFMVCGFRTTSAVAIQDDAARQGLLARDRNVPGTGELFSVTGVPVVVGKQTGSGPQVKSSGIYILRTGNSVTKVLMIK